MPSTRYQELEFHLEQLREHFLPTEFEPTGSYEERVFAHTKAYRVLAHAEFESFIEDRVLEIVERSYEQWQNLGTSTTALLGITAFKETTSRTSESFSEMSQSPKKYPDLASVVSHAKKNYNYYVRMENHGIKAKNLIRMLVPLGFTEADIDSEWLATTDAWATSRGEVAHRSAKVAVQPDPKLEFGGVNRILKGFSELDELLDVK